MSEFKKDIIIDQLKFEQIHMHGGYQAKNQLKQQIILDNHIFLIHVYKLRRRIKSMWFIFTRIS